ncbi:MAG: hypothetical protein M3680_23525 [Myxococcota bacterium]|nr:hypothetical protein [Myxococcota bacterium]
MIDADGYARSMRSNGGFPREGVGAILGTLRHDGNLARGFSVESTPTGAFGPFYDVG